MKFTFTCKKISLNDSIKAYAEKKISKLDRYFQEEATAFVTFAVEKELAAGSLIELPARMSGRLVQAICVWHKNRESTPAMRLFRELLQNSALFGT